MWSKFVEQKSYILSVLFFEKKCFGKCFITFSIMHHTTGILSNRKKVFITSYKMEMIQNAIIP